MGGLFGVISKRKCVYDLFYGVDYHSHLGTKRGGMAVLNDDHTFARSIHNLENSYFRIKFEDDLPKFTGKSGIAVISDNDPQPIVIYSKLGRFALCTVGKINNLGELEQDLLEAGKNFTELSGGVTNPTELVAQIISMGNDYAEGIRLVQQNIDGSCTMVILTNEGIIAARDLYGRTPLSIGKNDEGYAIASENCSFSNLGYDQVYELGPGEAVLVTENGYKQIIAPKEKLKICSFLWIYYGYPATSYEGINVDDARYRLGMLMGEEETEHLDVVSAIPDSGTCMAQGYAAGAKVPYRNAIVKYTPTWPRSFTTSNQETREMVARMKLIPNYSLMRGKSVAFCDDSIVRGTQLRDNVEIFRNHGVQEAHIRISCPPLIFPCKYVNFSASKSPLELITRRVIERLEGSHVAYLKEYAQYGSERYNILVHEIQSQLKMNSLRFCSIDNLVKAIGLPKHCLCTHCFDGTGDE